MARCEPRVSCINIKKHLKSRKISQFGLAPNVRERERERERERKEKKSKLLWRFHEVLTVGTRKAEN